jgi:hypothetical protein
MKRVKSRFVLLAVSILVLQDAAAPSQNNKEWQTTFSADKKNLGVEGSNPYFILTPGYQLSYVHKNDTETVTVLHETRMIDGVTTRVVEDRETQNGNLSELTRDFYAINSTTNDVYYFGEDVDVYKNGKIVDHEGSWMSGLKNAKFGLMMPAKPTPGRRFYQEQAPGVGMDRAEIVSINMSLTTPAGKFMNVVYVVENSPLETGTSKKWYVAGVGPVKDDDMVLVKYGVKP